MFFSAEHLLNSISIIHYSNFCPITNDPIENFFLLANSHLFSLFPYSYWLGWYGKLVNFISTFAWNYMDVFVMIISIGLSSKFQQLNDNLMKYKNEVRKSHPHPHPHTLTHTRNIHLIIFGVFFFFLLGNAIRVLVPKTYTISQLVWFM